MRRLNANDRDACCRCARVLDVQPAPGSAELALELIDQLKASGVPNTAIDDDLYIFRPFSGDPPQYMCGRCLREYYP